MTRRKIAADERRARLARRHHLAVEAQTPDPVEVARSIVTYHATDPPSVYLAAAARTSFAEPSALDRALYDDRTLVRMLGMRRTMFVVPTELMPAVQVACTDAIAVKERQRTIQMIVDGGITEAAEAWLAKAESATMAALSTRGEATTRELNEDVPELREKVVLSQGKAYESTTTMAPRVLFQLSAEGRVVRGRPVKSWVGNNRWALTGTWFPDGVPAVSTEDAEDALVRGWLAAFGPGTLADLKWWCGWTVSRTRRVLTRLGAVEVELDGGDVGYVLADDVEPVPVPEPGAVLLPSLDPAVMGWAMAGRDWYLGEQHRAALYDRSGNIGPTVWWDGHIVGTWAQRADGTVVHRLLEDVCADGRSAVAAIVERLQAWLGDRRVTPRFRTPLEKELSG